MTIAQSHKIKKLLPILSAVKLKCLDCSAQNLNEVKKCPCKTCPLYLYRFGSLNFSEQKSLSKNSNLEFKIDSDGLVRK